MAKSAAELAREIGLEVRSLKEREAFTAQQLNDTRVGLDKTKEELAAARQKIAVLRQQLLDHMAQVQEWDRRRWAVILLLLGCVLSLASGLIATLARRGS